MPPPPAPYPARPSAPAGLPMMPAPHPAAAPPSLATPGSRTGVAAAAAANGTRKRSSGWITDALGRTFLTVNNDAFMSTADLPWLRIVC